jgi:hypothetical protein
MTNQELIDMIISPKTVYYETTPRGLIRIELQNGELVNVTLVEQYFVTDTDNPCAPVVHYRLGDPQ